MVVEMAWISDDTRRVIESVLSMFVPHFSSESTAKYCKLHKIVASQGAINISQGAINIDNLVKFSTYSLLSDDLTVLESVEQGEVFTEGESFLSGRSNVALSARTTRCCIWSRNTFSSFVI